MKWEIVLLPVISVAGLECMDCPQDWRGDLVCDLRCMSAVCGFDSESMITTYTNRSDCYEDCAATGCNETRTGNGVCDEECKTQVCGWDGGDCGTCALGYLGDCAHFACSPGCYSYMIGDGTCQPECHNESCQWDSYDCDCFPGCTSVHLSNSICDSICDTAVCNYDNSVCVSAIQGECASGCFYAMIGNGVCDLDCYTEECEWDGLDCSCANDCHPSEYGTCKSTCLVPDCNYDKMQGHSQCSDQGLRTAALNYHLSLGNFTVPFSHPTTCQVDTFKCSSTEFTHSHTSCITACNTVSCGYSTGNCPLSTCTKPPIHCADCGLTDNSGCLNCIPGTYHFYRSCVSACPLHFHIHPLVTDLCYPDTDVSTPDSPFLYTVSSIPNPDGIGSPSNPFDSLSTALLCNTFNHTTIQLLPGVHFLHLRAASRTLHAWSQSLPYVSYANSLIIKRGECETDCEKDVVLVYDNLNPVQFRIHGHVTLSNITLLGNSTLVPSCTSPHCTYCPSLTIDSATNQATDDQGRIYPAGQYAAPSLCKAFKYNTLIYVTVNSRLDIEKGRIEGFRQGLGSIVTFTAGEVGVREVVFRDISTQSVQSSGKFSSTYLGAVIQQNSSNPISGFNMEGKAYETGFLSLYRVSVFLLNNGFELKPGLTQYGFISVNGLRKVTIEDCIFEDIVVQSGSLISLIVVIELKIDRCGFRYVYVEGSVIDVKPTGLFSFLPMERQGYPVDFYLNHIGIRNTTFRDVVAVSRSSSSYFSQSNAGSVISISMSGIQGMNTLIHSLQFTSCLVGSAYISISRSIRYAIPDTDLYGNVTLYTVNMTRIPLYIPPMWTRVGNISFRDAYSGDNIVAFSTLGNVEMSEVEIVDSGDGRGKVSPNSVLVAAMTTHPDVYLTSSPLPTAIPSCNVPISSSTVTNTTLSHVSILNSTCLNIPTINPRTRRIDLNDGGFGGIKVDSHTGPLIISDVVMRDVTAPTFIGGTCLTITSSGLIRVSDLEVTEVLNPSLDNTGLFTFTGTNMTSIELTGWRVTGRNRYGPVVQVFSGYTLKIHNSVFYGFDTTHLVYFSPFANTTWVSIHISDSLFNHNNGGTGAILYLDSTPTIPLTLTITNSEFSNNTSTGAGLVLYLDSNTVLTTNSTINSSKFTGNTAKDALIALYFINGTLTISDCTFTSNTGADTSLIVVSPLPQSLPCLILTNIYISGNTGDSLIKGGNPNGVVSISTQNITSIHNKVTILLLDRTSVTDTGSVFTSNQGSVLHCSTYSQLSFTDTVFRQGNSTNGGAVYLGGGSNMSCSNCLFDGNHAVFHGGAVYIEQESMIRTQHSTFKSNKSGSKGAAIFLMGSAVNSTIRNCTFIENYSGDSGVLVVISGSLRITSCRFEGNTGGKTVGISIYLSSVTVNSSVILNHMDLSAPFIFSALESVLVISNSTVKYLKSDSKGGFLYALSSFFDIISSNFSEIEAGNAPIVMTNAGTEFRMEDVRVKGVKSREQYAGVMVLTGGRGEIRESRVENFSGGGVVATDMTGLRLDQVEIYNNLGLSSRSTYGGVYCNGCMEVTVSGCVLGNLSAELGGAMYIVGNKLTEEDMTLTVTNSVFMDIHTREGGVYVDNMLSLFHLSTFQSCNASLNGGALSLYCSQTEGCSYIFQSCLFTNNSAAISGGSIHWLDTRPLIQDCIFQHGSAYYGPDFSSFPVHIHIQSIHGNASVSGNNTEYEGTLYGIASGQTVSQTILAAVLDHYEQVVTTLNGPTATLLAVDENSNLFGSTSVPAVNGTFNFSNFGITATPDSTISFSLSTSVIDLSKSFTAHDNVTYHPNTTLRAVLRPCQIGESLFQGQCAICPSGKYSLSPEISCQDCSSNAICYGNYTMVPREGYWRSSIYSDVFWKCPYKSSCVGSPAPPDPLSLTGKCAEGYFGNLCNGCLPGFSRLNQVECGRCPSYIVNLVRTAGIALAFLIILIIIVASAIRSAYQTSSFFSIYIKILLNYLQLVMLTSSLNLNWPSYMLELVKAQQTAGNVTDQVFSIDCFFESDSQEDQATAVRSKIVILSFLPVIMGLMGAAFWLPYAVFTRKWSKLTNELLTTSVVFFFLIHPSLVKFMFAFLDCKELDRGEYWMNSFLNIRCWNGMHTRFALIVAVPSIIVWGLGMPTVCLVYLVRNRNHLALTKNRLKFGFIYNGYEKRTFFWELVIIYRKLMLISITVFLANISVYVQALSAMLVIIIAMILQSKHSPYIVSDMNSLELRGILVGGVTIYGGMYSLSGNLDFTSLMVIFVLIVCLNVYFVGYWLLRVGKASWVLLTQRIGFLKRIFGQLGYRIQPRNVRTTALTSVLSDHNVKPSSVNVSADLSAMIDEDQRSSIPQVPDNSVRPCEESSERYRPEA